MVMTRTCTIVTAWPHICLEEIPAEKLNAPTRGGRPQVGAFELTADSDYFDGEFYSEVAGICMVNTQKIFT